MNRYNELNSTWDTKLSPRENYNKIISVVKSEAEHIIYKAKTIVNHITQEVKSVILNIKNSFESLAAMLRKLEYKREYYSWTSIKRMAGYILDNNLFNNISFIIDAVNSFRELIQFKGSKMYVHKLEEFKLELRKFKNKFYTEIYTPTHKYDDLIVKITNVPR